MDASNKFVYILSMAYILAHIMAYIRKYKFMLRSMHRKLGYYRILWIHWPHRLIIIPLHYFFMTIAYNKVHYYQLCYGWVSVNVNPLRHFYTWMHSGIYHLKLYLLLCTQLYLYFIVSNIAFYEITLRTS